MPAPAKKTGLLKLKKRPQNIKAAPTEAAWKILIVDDEEEVHSVTRLALKNYMFGGRPLEFFYAYSGDEACKIMAKHRDMALVLLDVVMETEHSGLDVVRYIREKLRNKLVRIVLRTGQPGQAPERRVIVDYDINDYKEKTELTAQKLFTVFTASLRSYRDMLALENSRIGLKKIIYASANIFTLRSMREFAEGALSQMLALLHIQDKGSFYGSSIDSLAAFKSGSHFKVVAGTGKYEELPDEKNQLSAIPLEVFEHLQEAAIENGHKFSEDHIVNYYKGLSGHENLLYVSGELNYNDIDTNLVELYARNVGIAFENIGLRHQLEETQREIVYRLGEAVETRSLETGNHLKRVAEISKLLALAMGLSKEEAEELEYASPLHDVGKIGIPDAILNKPGKHTPEEWKIMQNHAELGFKMLKSSDKPILQAGAIIALEHHEKWDGTGYPNKKKGEEIHIYGRITALADVYDALASERCYKEPWPLDDINLHIKQQRGKHFQPEAVDALIENLDAIEKIMKKHPDIKHH